MVVFACDDAQTLNRVSGLSTVAVDDYLAIFARLTDR